MTLGTRIKELRIKQNLNQTNLAKLVKSSSQMISMIEADKNKPTLELLTELSSLFGVSTDYLLTGKEGTTEISSEEQELINLYREDSQIRKALKNTLELKKKALDQLGSLTAKDGQDD